jgi:C1A family cysteine protease
MKYALAAVLFFTFSMAALCADAPHRHKHHYGWKGDAPGIHKVNAIHNPRIAFAQVAQSVDLTPLMPEVYDQGQIGSCTGNGSAAVWDFDNAKTNGGHFYGPSRLFIYYNARVIEGTPDQDSGAQIHDVISALLKQGTPSETEWPYNVDAFAQKPSDCAYADALTHRATHAYSVDNDGGGLQIRQALSAGYPVVFGCSVYDAIESLTPQDYKLPMPQGDSVGGHCMVIVGYTVDGFYIVRNSWGMGYANRGYLLMPRAYIEGQWASDFWVIDSVAGTK